jgi:hypothetical protein
LGSRGAAADGFYRDLGRGRHQHHCRRQRCLLANGLAFGAVFHAAGATRPVATNVIAAQPVAARRDDPIADLIAPQPSPRIMAVQRALSEYGYGQIRPSGVLDGPTGSAIQKFEHEHKLPVTGRISDRLVSELTSLVGHPLN